MVYLTEFVKDCIIKLKIVIFSYPKEKEKKASDSLLFFVRQRFPGESSSNYGVVQLFGDIFFRGPYAGD